MALNELISKFEYAANNPKQLMKDYLASGNKVVGCAPVYTPEEIVHASGMIPMGIWGGQVELESANQYFPAFACSIMQSIMEYGLRGSYNGLSAIIIPCMCDTLICMTQNWKSGVTSIPMIPFVYPQNRKIQAGVDYLITEFEGVKKKLEDICGHEITEESMAKSIDIYNEHRAVMREFVELVPDYLNTITPYIRNCVIKSGHFMKKEDHTELVKELNKTLKAMPKENFTGKKVLVTGIILDSKEILDVFESNNIAVAYDNTAQESRQFMTPVPDGDNALERLARQWSNIEGCTLAYDPYKKRGKMIVENVKRLDLDGVVYAMMKFCDPEEYDYPIVKMDLDGAEIPHLYIETEQQSTSIEQIRTRIQTFADILA
ncbi:2-hydroxyacyl-CoA dehydratase subunit D [Peptostreptococcus faecalis]|uniref:2-hydroxyacyl-CoA dehydratase subunit D n=1 Tax=Peptostreptococcus faecalis TaxID=2045015 RepID=UPI000C7E0C82|nr:2-hydroxyacyl-CoA dehydratase family protein [Peptostreptococcus faecalis]